MEASSSSGPATGTTPLNYSFKRTDSAEGNSYWKVGIAGLTITIDTETEANT